MVEAEKGRGGWAVLVFYTKPATRTKSQRESRPLNSTPAFSIVKPRLSSLCLYYSAPTHEGDKGYKKSTKNE